MTSPKHFARLKEKKTVEVRTGDIKYISIPVGITADDLAAAVGAFADEHPDHQMVKTYRDRKSDALVLTFSN
ncbi:hypothetical protein ABT299_20140 [Spirillospora sp. NPDC000708]